jgi:esterase/lipase superfamily enzyme
VLALLLSAVVSTGVGAVDTTHFTSVDTTYYVTNRARVAGRLTARFADSLEFGFVVTRFRERASAVRAGRYLDAIDSRAVDSVRLTREEFTSRVRAADAWAAARGEGAMVYVHGAASEFGRAIAQAAEIAHRGSYGGPLIVFAWPSRAALRSWPSRVALISGGYREDSVAAHASEPAFRDALATVLRAARPGALTLVTHSMGAQLVTGALHSDSRLREELMARPVGSMAFYAADVSAARFADTLAPALRALAMRRVVYASSKDRMLTLSRLVNHSARVGQRGGERRVAGGDVEVVDVTSGRRSDGIIRKLVDPNHSLRWASSALYDLFAMVRGLPEECRTAGGVAERTGERSWRLTGAPIPAAPPACFAH